MPHHKNIPPSTGLSDTILCTIFAGKDLFIHVSLTHAYNIENRSLKSLNMLSYINFFIYFTPDDPLLSSIEVTSKNFQVWEGRWYWSPPKLLARNLTFPVFSPSESIRGIGLNTRFRCLVLFLLYFPSLRCLLLYNTVTNNGCRTKSSWQA